MSRKFRLALSQYFEYGSAIVTAAPFTYSCWFNPDASNTDQVLISLSDSSGANYFAMGKNTSGALYVETGGGAIGSTTNTFQARKWNHAAGAFPSASTGSVWLNGGGKGTFSGGATQSGINKFDVGVNNTGGLFGLFDGLIDRVALWNAALTDQHVARLAGGEHARRVLPSNLIGYWEFDQEKEIWIEFDQMNGRHLLRKGGATPFQGSPFPTFARTRRKPTWFLHVAAAGGDISGSAGMLFGAGSSVLTGSGSLAGSAALIFDDGASAMQGAGALAGSCALVFAAGSSTLAGAGALAGSCAVVFAAGSSTLAGSGALAGSAVLTFSNSGTVLGTGALAGSAALTLGHGASTLSGAGALAGSGTLTFGHGSSALSGTGALAGAAVQVFGSGNSQMSGTGAMSALGALAFGAGGSTARGAGVLAGSLALAFVASATGMSVGALAGSASTVLTGTGAALGAGSLAGSAAVVVASTGSAAGAGAMSGSCVLTIAPTGTASDAQALSGGRAAWLEVFVSGAARLESFALLPEGEAFAAGAPAMGSI